MLAIHFQGDQAPKLCKYYLPLSVQYHVAATARSPYCPLLQYVIHLRITTSDMELPPWASTVSRLFHRTALSAHHTILSVHPAILSVPVYRTPPSVYYCNCIICLLPPLYCYLHIAALYSHRTHWPTVLVLFIVFYYSFT